MAKDVVLNLAWRNRFSFSSGVTVRYVEISAARNDSVPSGVAGINIMSAASTLALGESH